MESPRHHKDAVISSIVQNRKALRVFSVVTLIASGALGLAGGTTTHASTAAYSVTNLGTLSGNLDDTTQAYAINGNGQIVGKSVVQKNGTFSYHAFLYSAGKMTDLGTLKSGNESEAQAIDKYGDVAGSANTCKGCYPYDAFLYQNGTMQDLGSFGDASVAEAINNLGVIVGSADVLGADRAAIFSGGTLQDLNNLIPAGSGVILTEATGINDKGQIVCNGDNASGYGNAFLLNPT